MRAILGLSLAGLVVGVAFIVWPQIDIWFTSFFFLRPVDFVMSTHPFALFVNGMVEVVAAVLSVFFLGGLALTHFRRRPLFGLTRRVMLFLTLSMAIGPGLVVNGLLKEHSGRPRPSHVQDFGAPKTFIPAFGVSDQCAGNCSFVSGDASVGFVTLALALLAVRRRCRWIIASIGLGAFFGLIRIAQGGHFLSDVLFSGFFVGLTTLILYELIVVGVGTSGAGTADPEPEQNQPGTPAT